MAASNSLSPKSVWPTSVLMLVLVMASAGCQWVFGDFEFRPEDGAGGSNGAGGAGVTGGSIGAGGVSVCAEGTHTCTTNGQPQTCSNGVWVNVGSVCSPMTPCSVSKGACDVCASGNKSCSSDGTSVLTCNADNNSWTTRPCTGNTPYCDADKHDCVACIRGESRCKGAATLQKCNSSQTGFDDFACPDYPCFTFSSTEAYCASCDPAVDLPSCSTVGLLIECSASTHLTVPTKCTIECVTVADPGADYCR